MLIGSLIGYPPPEDELESINGDAIIEMVKYLTGFCDIVCYTDNNASQKAVDWTKDHHHSVVQIIRPVPDIRMVYRCAWEHLEWWGADQHDWVILLNSYELLYGPEYLSTYFDAFPYEAIGVVNDIGLVEPRIFRYYHGGCNFYPGNIWPSYVDDMILRRPHVYCADNEMQLMDFREEKDFLDFI